MLSGSGLGIWAPLLKTRKDAVDACRAMEQTLAFCSPSRYDAVSAESFDALLLPGGHDKGVREYLESETLQDLVVAFFERRKPVVAICHGVVLAARSINPITGNSVISNYETTCLLKSQEMAAFQLTRLWLKDYYLTYPEIAVEDEVRAVLENVESFKTGPKPLLRDDLDHLARGFTVRDRNYLSARWPGDAYNFSLEFIRMLEE